MSKTQSIIDALLKMGSVERPSKSRKYRTFTNPRRIGEFFFVGRAGAFRAGRASSKSISLATTVDRMIAAASKTPPALGIQAAARADNSPKEYAEVGVNSVAIPVRAHAVTRWAKK